MADPANPFAPGRGRIPGHGRGGPVHPLGRMIGHLDEVISRRKGKEVHLRGPRGCGKTALLRMLAEEAAPKGAQVVWAEQMAGDSRTKAEARIKKAARRRAAVALFDDAHRLPAVGGKRPDPASAQEIADAKGVGNAYRAAHSLMRTRHPVLLVVAGAPYEWRADFWGAREDPESGPVLVDAGMLEAEEIDRALHAPVTGTGMWFDDGAAGLITLECGGHPPLLQALASAAWESARAAGRSRIRQEDAESAARAVRKRKGRALAARLKVARRAGILRKCLAIAEAIRSQNPHADHLRLDLGSVVDPAADPPDLGIPVHDVLPVLESADDPGGPDPRVAFETMVRLGLFHLDRLGRTGAVQSYPTLCEHLLGHAGGDAPRPGTYRKIRESLERERLAAKLAREEEGYAEDDDWS